MTQLSAPRTISSYGFGAAFREIQERSNSAHSRFAKLRVQTAIQQVSQRQDNWDGCGSDRPSEAACSRAVTEASAFVDVAFTADLGWQDPYVGSNESGEVSLEWWRGEKRLTIYVGSEDMHYVCSWGPDINNTMDAGLLTPEGFLQKWRWFRM
jgi:hypothetical protein